MAEKVFSYIKKDLSSPVPRIGFGFLIAVEILLVALFSFLIAYLSVSFALLVFLVLIGVILFVNDHILSSFSFWSKMKKDLTERLNKLFYSN